MYKIELRKKARDELRKFSPTTRQITLNRLSELKNLGADGADGTLTSDERVYHYTVTSVSVIIFDVLEDETIIVVYVIRATEL